MIQKFNGKSVLGISLVAALVPLGVHAEISELGIATNSVSAPDRRTGLFDWLDNRSVYNQDFFPQPLIVDDTGLETDGEVEFASQHTAINGQSSDLVSAGVQKSFGLLTLELSVPYERIYDQGERSQGVGSINVGTRYPVYQYVSPQDLFDTTLGVALEAGLPVNSAVSQNTELTPKVFNDLKLGKYFAVQSVLGYATLLDGGTGGLQIFEYGIDFSCAIPPSQFTLPGVEQLIPMVELSGATELNQAAAGRNSLLGSLGFRLNLKAIGDLQPTLGLGYIFPVDEGAHTEVQWGLATSLTLGF